LTNGAGKTELDDLAGSAPSLNFWFLAVPVLHFNVEMSVYRKRAVAKAYKPQRHVLYCLSVPLPKKHLVPFLCIIWEKDWENTWEQWEKLENNKRTERFI